MDHLVCRVICSLLFIPLLPIKDHFFSQPLQKTTIVARPIAPAPIQAQMSSHTLARVGQGQTVGSVLPSSKFAEM